jgi:hypothetical protein
MLGQQGQIAMLVGALLVAVAVGALNGFWFGVMFFGFAAMAWGIVAVITEYADR